MITMVTMVTMVTMITMVTMVTMVTRVTMVTMVTTVTMVDGMLLQVVDTCQTSLDNEYKKLTNGVIDIWRLAAR